MKLDAPEGGHAEHNETEKTTLAEWAAKYLSKYPVVGHLEAASAKTTVRRRVHVRVHACACVHVCTHVRVPVRVRVRMCVCPAAGAGRGRGLWLKDEGLSVEHEERAGIQPFACDGLERTTNPSFFN